MQLTALQHDTNPGGCRGAFSICTNAACDVAGSKAPEQLITIRHGDYCAKITPLEVSINLISDCFNVTNIQISYWISSVPSSVTRQSFTPSRPEKLIKLYLGRPSLLAGTSCVPTLWAGRECFLKWSRTPFWPKRR